MHNYPVRKDKLLYCFAAVSDISLTTYVMPTYAVYNISLEY